MNTIDIETILKVILASVILAWNVLEGAPLENQYPTALVKLYTVPLWRFVLLLAMIAGAEWSPSVAMMIAFAIFFYVMDMEVTLEKWV